MASLVIVDLTPLDKSKLMAYSERAAKTLEPFNGRFLAKGEAETLHGQPKHVMKAVIEFPDKESAKSWYNSAAYQEIIPLREEGMQSQFQLI